MWHDRVDQARSVVREIAVFSGSAHPELAAEVCDHLGVPLNPVRVNRFANDCLEVQLQACRERDVFLIQPLVTPVQENLVERLLMCDAARGASASRSAFDPRCLYARTVFGGSPQTIVRTAGCAGDRVHQHRAHTDRAPHRQIARPVDRPRRWVKRSGASTTANQ